MIVHQLPTPSDSLFRPLALCPHGARRAAHLVWFLPHGGKPRPKPERFPVKSNLTPIRTGTSCTVS